MTHTDEALKAVADERARQHRLKREGRVRDTCDDPTMSAEACLAVLREEVSEVARSVLEVPLLDTHGQDLRAESGDQIDMAEDEIDDPSRPVNGGDQGES